MPLVIAVLAFMVLIFNCKDSIKRNTRLEGNQAKDRLKTNAKLEQRTLDMYLKYGYSFADAFQRTYQDMYKAGYEPCIPYEAYLKLKDGSGWSSFCDSGNNTYLGRWNERLVDKGFSPGQYDSEWVRDRRRAIYESYQINHPEEEISSSELERLTYENFPKTEWEHQRDIKISANISKAEPIGTYIIYPNLGTCEVLGYYWVDHGAAGGAYKLKVLKTGEIVNRVLVGDEKIRKQGR